MRPKKCYGLFSSAQKSGLSFSFWVRYHPKIGVFFKITVTFKYPDFGIITILKWKTETTFLCRVKQAATFGVLRRLKGHHQGANPLTPFQNTQNTGYFEKGWVDLHLDDAILNAGGDQKLRLVELDTNKWSQFFILSSLSSQNRGISKNNGHI